MDTTRFGRKGGRVTIAWAFSAAALIVGSSVAVPAQAPKAQGPAKASAPSSAQGTTVKATLPANITPPWHKGIRPISRESYWHAIECGKQGGAQPPCVFYDAGLCANPDFTLALYTPYKQVAYTVWQAVSKQQEPPTPSYTEAQRTRVILGITPARGSQNAIAGVVVKRGGQVVKPSTQSVDGGRGTFIFDFPAFAPTSGITIEMIGKTRTQSCVVDRSVLARFR